MKTDEREVLTKEAVIRELKLPLKSAALAYCFLLLPIGGALLWIVFWLFAEYLPVASGFLLLCAGLLIAVPAELIYKAYQIKHRGICIAIDKVVRIDQDGSSEMRQRSTPKGSLHFQNAGAQRCAKAMCDATRPGDIYYLVTFTGKKGVQRIYPAKEYRLEEKN